jgi:phytoene dehydrogenase-like protein
MENKYDCIVVGGGASGMMACGRLAERGLRVLLLEKNKKLGGEVAYLWWRPLQHYKCREGYTQICQQHMARRVNSSILSMTNSVREIPSNSLKIVDCHL